jgi:hypothetical protein
VLNKVRTTAATTEMVLIELSLPGIPSGPDGVRMNP